jgi:uncharacterized lipoprotein
MTRQFILLALLVSIITSCQSNDEPNETKNSSENYLSEETIKTMIESSLIAY